MTGPAPTAEHVDRNPEPDAQIVALCLPVVAGIEAGFETILVLSGVTTRDEADRFPYRPSSIIDSVADLLDEDGR